jgi:predicted ATPase
MLPETPARAQQELGLQTILAQAWKVIKGNASPEVEQAAARARELCQQMGETWQLFPVLSMLEGLYRLRAELSTAQELAEQLLCLAQRTQEPVHLAWAHYKLGATLFSLGELISARAHLEQTMAIVGPEVRSSLTFRSLSGPWVSCVTCAAWDLWLLGYPDQALERSQEALMLAQEQMHPFSLVQALLWAAGLRQFRRERAEAQAHAEAAMLLSTEQGFPSWLPIGMILRGWTLAAQGHGAESIAQIHQALAAQQAIGVKLGDAYWLALLAEAYGYEGQTHEGLDVVVKALATVHNRGGRWWEAELYRLRGELLLHTVAQPEEAEACLQQALEVAHHQHAKSLELRAAVTLSRLWQRQKKREEARQLLMPIYGWFTEGFDTIDLQEAKALLEELER